MVVISDHIQHILRLMELLDEFSCGPVPHTFRRHILSILFEGMCDIPHIVC